MRSLTLRGNYISIRNLEYIFKKKASETKSMFYFSGSHAWLDISITHSAFKAHRLRPNSGPLSQKLWVSPRHWYFLKVLLMCSHRWDLLVSSLNDITKTKRKDKYKIICVYINYTKS